MIRNPAPRRAFLRRTIRGAVKGFSPTPEFPEIAEAQTLLVALT